MTALEKILFIIVFMWLLDCSYKFRKIWKWADYKDEEIKTTISKVHDLKDDIEELQDIHTKEIEKYNIKARKELEKLSKGK